MGWNDTTKMMSLPISAGDISQAVSYRSTDIGTLVRQGYINKWAKYKPIARPGIDFSDDLTNGSWKSTATWWHGVDDKCGLSYDIATSLGSVSSSGDFFYKLMHEQLPWNYIRPNGGINAQPFRVFDFIEYYGNAQCPAENISSTDIWMDVSTDWYGQLSFDTNASGDYELALSDFKLSLSNIDSGAPAVNECYLGAVLWQPNNVAGFYYGTSTTPITRSSAMTITFTGQAFAGEWKCVPFISSEQYPFDAGSQQQAVNGRYASLFGFGVSTITIHAPGTAQDIVASCEWNSTHTGINCIITIENHEGQERTITGLGLEIRMYDPGEQPTDGDNVTGSPFSFSGSFVVPAHTDVVAVTEFLPNISKEEGKLYAAHAYATGHMNSRWEEVGDVPDGENRN